MTFPVFNLLLSLAMARDQKLSPLPPPFSHLR